MAARFSAPHTFALALAISAMALSSASQQAKAQQRSRSRSVDAPAAAAASPAWPGERMPLPLTVESPADLVVKTAAERYYLIFNLLTSGKLAWERGDWVTAARKWDDLLALPDVPRDIGRVIRPMTIEARRRAEGQPASTVVPLPSDTEIVAELDDPAVPASTSTPDSRATPTSGLASVSGTVSGGGKLGSEGAVVWLKRKDGRTPKPRPLRGRVLDQRDKDFVPHILPVTVGTTVSFRNQDPIHHNVFSLSRPNDFDSGLYAAGGSYERRFDQPGAVQILCNIHASMLAYVVVVDSPWYALVRQGGSFTIRGVPPGEYELYAWHEASSGMTRAELSVGADGLRGVALAVGSDRQPPRFVPDKYGKARQVHLGY